MALSLMVEYDDVRLAEQAAHSLAFMGTKWIDPWVVYQIVAQARVHFHSLNRLQNNQI